MPASAVFWIGYDARLKGDSPDTCPYPVDSPKGRDWLEGWDDKIVARRVDKEDGSTQATSR